MSSLRNPTMTTAFQQTKQVAIDVLKAKKRYNRLFIRKGARLVPEKDHKNPVPANRNCPAQTVALVSTKHLTALVQPEEQPVATVKKSNIESMSASRRNWMRGRKGKTLTVPSRTEAQRDKENEAELLAPRSKL